MEAVIAPLRAGADALEVVTVAGEPTVDDARAAAAAGRALAADVVVAIGGGSPIDLAKAAAMLLGNGGDPMDYIEVVGRGQPITPGPRAAGRRPDDGRDRCRGHGQRRARASPSTG